MSSAGIFDVLLVVTVALVGYMLITFFRQRKPSKMLYPPGPKGVPIFGNLLQLINQSSEEKIAQLAGWNRQYGDIIGLKVGPKMIIHLFSYDFVYEAFVTKGDSLNERPVTAVLKSLESHMGVTMSSGPTWKMMRRFSTSVLRNFGMGRNKMEESIKMEAECLIEELKKTDGTPIRADAYLQKAVGNIIGQVVFGHRHEYDDNDFNYFLATADEYMAALGDRATLLMPPWMKHIPIIGKNIVRLHNARYKMYNFFQKKIDEHRSTLDAENPRDLFDYYLINPTLNMNVKIDTLRLKRISDEMFRAGTDTATSTLTWAILFMLRHPDSQRKVHQELDRVIGNGRRPTVGDQSSCPYTKAVTMEVLRCGSIASHTLEHIASDDITIGGFDVPKGSIVYAQIYQMNRCERYWKDPYNFNPENFLNENGDFENSANFTPFGIGPRICMGEAMARMEIWLFFSAILQEYELTLPAGDPLPSLGCVDGIVRHPMCFRVLVKPRN